MAKFKKGQSGNPKGKLPDPPEVKGIKELTRHNLMIILNKYMYKSRDELKELLKDGSVIVIEAMVIRLMVEVMSKADNRTFEMLVERIVGKTPVVVQQHNFDETKDKGAVESEKLLLKILLDQKSEDIAKVYVAQGLLEKKKDD
jgi:hypothetical protein